MARRISLEEYKRIQSLVAAPVKREQDCRREEKKAKCNDRVSRWPNTLEALRKQKEEAFLQRKEVRELELKEIDRQEDEKRARERREKIEYASSTIYRATDKMKRLLSAELLVDCIDGRNQQVELNKLIRDSETKFDQQFLAMERARMKKMEEREISERQARKKQAKEIAAYQGAQLKEMQGRYRQRLDEEKEEGRKIAERAEQEREEDRQEYRNKMTKAKENALQIFRANQQLNDIRAEQKKVEDEEDRKTEEHAARKEELKLRQKAQAAKIEAHKQKKRQEMIDEGVRRLKEFTFNDEKRIENQVAERRAAEDNLARIRNEKRAIFAEQIRQSREQQTNMRNKQREDRLTRERAFAEKWREHNIGLEQQQRDERMAELRAAKEHQEYLKIQAHEKRLRELTEKHESDQNVHHLIQNIAEEEDEFRRIAQKRIDRLVAEGKDPYPLKKCVAEVCRQHKTLMG